MSERRPVTFAGFGHGVNLLAPERCVSEVRKFLADAAARERLLGQGLDPIGNSTEAFSKLLREELPKWGKVVKISGAKVD